MNSQITITQKDKIKLMIITSFTLGLILLITLLTTNHI
jgi:hypothetical protein